MEVIKDPIKQPSHALAALIANGHPYLPIASLL
jgi:hypothetical protein